jgi:hypothetical protein
MTFSRHNPGHAPSSTPDGSSVPSGLRRCVLRVSAHDELLGQHAA